MKFFFILIVLCIGVIPANAQLIKSDFFAGYSIGDDLEKGTYPSTTQGEDNPIKINQWNLTGKTGDNEQSPASVSPKIVAPLTYANYPESGKDFATELPRLSSGARASVYSLADDNTYGAGTYYLAFLSNVSIAASAGHGFLSFDTNYTGNIRRCHYSMQKIDNDTYKVGLGNTGNPEEFSETTFNFNQTYLSVIKITLDGSGNGTASLFMNPEISQTEPAPLVTTDITGMSVIRAIVLRQRNTLAVSVGGMRFARSWEAAIRNVKQPQSITWGDIVSEGVINKTINDAPFTLPAKTDQDQPITYTIEPATGVATIGGENNNTFTIVATTATEAVITAKAEATDDYEALEETIQLKLTSVYSWLTAPAIAVEGNTVKVVGPGADEFTKITIDGEEGIDLSAIEAGKEVKLEATDGTQKIRLIIKK